MDKRWICLLLLGLFLFKEDIVYGKSDLNRKYGAKGALQDPAITLQEGLRYAIEEEYLEQAQYSFIINRFGSIKPYPEVMAAEEKHLSMLLLLCKKYNVTAPINRGELFRKEPRALREAFQVSIESERENIAMYKKLCIISDFPNDVQSLMQRFGYITENHLVAFKREMMRLP